MRTSTRQDWLAAAAILAGLAAVYVIPAATTGASLARATAAMTIAALIALAVARAPFTFALRVRTGFVLLVLLALWYVTTRLWAVEPAGSMVESSRVSAFVLLAWAAHTCVVGVGARRLLLGGVAAAAAFVSAKPLWNAITDGAPTIREAGELGYWNATAIVALVLVPTAVALAGTGSRRLIVAGSLLIPLAGVAAVASASRGALAALVVALLVQALLDPDYRGSLPRAFVAGVSLGLVVFALAIDGMPVAVALLGPVLVAIGGFGLIRARRVRRDRAELRVVEESDVATPALRRPRLIHLAGGALIATLAVLLVALVLDANEGEVPSAGPATAGDVTRLATTDDSSRFEWWREGIDLWQGAPLHGRGGGAFGALHVEGRGTNLEHVHSMPLEVLLETGLIGALLLAGATVMLLRVLRRGHRSTERALAGAICALLLGQSLLDWTLSLPQVLVLLAIVGPIALTRPPDPADPEAPTAPAQVPPSAAITMLVALAAATTIALTPVLASLLADQAARRFDEGDPAEAASLAEQSLVLVPSIDTLQVQVISLQSDGREDEARDVLRDNEQVWLHRLDGLQLAQPLLADDPERGPDIERRIAKIEAERDARTPGLN